MKLIDRPHTRSHLTVVPRPMCDRCDDTGFVLLRLLRATTVRRLPCRDCPTRPEPRDTA